MATEIFYFSGTGNSLYVARELAERIEDASLSPIVGYGGSNPIRGRGDCLGLVFPIHSFSMPAVVAEFLKAVDAASYSYIFMVATKGGSPDLSYSQANKILKKQAKAADAFFAIEMPNNTYFIHDIDADEEMAEKYAAAEKAIERIAGTVNARKACPPESVGKPLTMAMLGLVHRILTPTGYMGFGSKFYVRDSCTKCGICAETCPSGKIEIIDGAVTWRLDRQCLICGACVNYCPAKAIGNKELKPSRSQPGGQYHHPKVSAREIGSQRKAQPAG